MRLTSNGGMFFQQLAGGFRKSEGGLFAEIAAGPPAARMHQHSQGTGTSPPMLRTSRRP
jgi:hypothetical protein